MTKSELRNGMFVQCENSNWYMVSKGVKADGGIRDTLANLDGGWMSLDKWNNNLKFTGYDDGYEITRIIEGTHFPSVLSQLIQGTSPDKLRNAEVLWERSNPKITEVESLIAKLQSQLSDAKAELEALR